MIIYIYAQCAVIVTLLCITFMRINKKGSSCTESFLPESQGVRHAKQLIIRSDST